MKVSVYIGTSLDGFIARKDNNIDWLVKFADDDAMRTYEKFINKIDVIVIGRGTFEKVLTFSSWSYTKQVFVLSSSIKEVSESLKDRVTVLSMNPRNVLNHLSDLGYTNVYLDGGNVIQEFLKQDLIDELIISKVPVLIGGGKPLFGYLNSDLQFRHIRTEVYSNELVRSYYERKRT